MNKFLQKVAKLFLGISMAAGVGVAVKGSKRANGVAAASPGTGGTDVINVGDLQATTNSYVTFSGVTKTSGAIYAGKTARDTNNGSYIQLRSSNSDSGIYTTETGGIAKKVSLTWKSGVASGRTLQVFGKNTAYTAMSELYSNSQATKGELLGTIVAGTSTETNLSKEYPYIAIRSSSGAFQFSGLTITWDAQEEDTRSELSLSATGAGGASSVGINQTLALTVTARSGGQVVTNLTNNYGYSSSNTSIATVNSSGVITGKAAGSATITISYSGDDNYKSAQVPFPITVTKVVTPLPASGDITITGSHPTIGGYGTDVAYTVEEDNTPGSEFGFNCTQVMKSGENLQFKASAGVLYSTTALSYILEVVVTGDYSNDAEITYGTSRDSGCTNTLPGNNSTYFKVANSAGNARYWKISVSYGTPKEVVAFSITGSIGDTPRNTDYDLTGLQLHAWYDSQKTDEASATVASAYELVAVPTTAGSSVDPNNEISVQVYLKTDTSHSNCLATFTNVAAPIVTDPKGSVNNPYTASEAKEIATAMSSGDKLAEKYVLGIISQIDTSVTWSSSNGYKSFWISDDGSSSNQYKMYHSYYLAASQKMTEEQFNSLKVGDRVLMCGTIERYGSGDSIDMDPCFVYQHTQNELNSTLVVSGNKTSFTHGETLVLGNNLSITASYAVSGNKTVDVSEVTYTLGGTAVTTPVELDAATDNGKQVVITYTDAARGSSATYSYSISVVYADVSSVVLTEHNVTVEPTSTHDFTATLNSGVNPSQTVSWAAVNDDGSLIPTANIKIESTGNLTAKLTLTAASNVNGAIIVTATVGSVSDTCTVTVTGDAYVTFNKDSIHGIVGATVDNSVKVTPVGLGTPTSYTWSVTSGSDVISATSGSDTSTLTFKAAGTATLHVVVSDGSDTAEGDISVDVIKSLNSITIPGGTTEHNEGYVVADQSYTNGDAVSSWEGTNFTLGFDKGTGSNAPKYYTGSPTGLRVYGGGTITVSSSTKTLTKIAIVASNSAKTISASTGSVDGYEWTGSASSVTFTVSGGSGNLAVTSITAYWEVSSADVPIANTNYNAQKAVLEFAEDLTTKLNEVCLQGEGGTTVVANLNVAWTNIHSTYTSKRNSLGSSDQEVFDTLIARATANEAGDDLQKALRSYEWVYAKYHDSLTAGDFLNETSGRGAVSYSSLVNPLVNIIGENTNTVAIIVIISMVSVTAIGGYFFLRKRKENI